MKVSILLIIVLVIIVVACIAKKDRPYGVENLTRPRVNLGYCTGSSLPYRGSCPSGYQVKPDGRGGQCCVKAECKTCDGMMDCCEIKYGNKQCSACVNGCCYT